MMLSLPLCTLSRPEPQFRHSVRIHGTQQNMSFVAPCCLDLVGRWLRATGFGTCTLCVRKGRKPTCMSRKTVLYDYSDMISAANFWTETEQENDRIELVEARNTALATRGLFASCTPTMAWNYHFGDMEAFYAERFAQVDAQNSLESQDVPRQRPKRAAAVTASEAWKELSPRKRQRRQ